MEHLRGVSEIDHLFKQADHVDVKVVEGEVELAEFIAGMMSYSPGWLRSLYAVRGVFARALGMGHSGFDGTVFRAEDLTLLPGDKLMFFTTVAAQSGLFWIGEVTDKPLTAYLAVAMEPLGNGRNRFHVATFIRYRNWTGPIYFNLIRPFHHVVVRQMAMAGAVATA
ncbi:hypothetical protein GGQ74_000652 [Desulfobaculum xiamenense]|uniref:DUF2867 domain-containing protein n=1 Tax=Desulfobaculum xiamenense TaxID=995050 RepID=A0A846QKN1_9BACT|nr:DUF2867 domain-containing protein [Desulfobaculum xiamenense]NJB67012.1 hypothetical protein [Desulfobaculum xiamenense]